MKEIWFYQHTNNKVPVVEWLKSLDKGIRIRIQDRLTRIEQDDNFGDFKKLDNEISELRFSFGSGYRIYYTEVNNVVVLLLNAGDKKLQSNDISKAKEYLSYAFEQYIEDGNFNVFYRALELVIKSRDTMQGFAGKVDLSRMGLYNIIQGKKEPKITTLVKILKELGLTLKVA